MLQVDKRNLLAGYRARQDKEDNAEDPGECLSNDQRKFADVCVKSTRISRTIPNNYFPSSEISSDNREKYLCLLSSFPKR